MISKVSEAFTNIFYHAAHRNNSKNKLTTALTYNYSIHPRRAGAPERALDVNGNGAGYGLRSPCGVGHAVPG